MKYTVIAESIKYGFSVQRFNDLNDYLDLPAFHREALADILSLWEEDESKTVEYKVYTLHLGKNAAYLKEGEVNILVVLKNIEDKSKLVTEYVEGFVVGKVALS